MVYDRALEQRPGDLDLLTARGWLMARLPADELREIGRGSLDDVLEADPTRADALVYRSYVRAQLGDLDGARDDLAVFDGLDPSPPAEKIRVPPGSKVSMKAPLESS